MSSGEAISAEALTWWVWMKDSCRVPHDPPSSWSVKLLPSALTASCQFLSSCPPLSSFSTSTLYPPLPITISVLPFCLSSIHRSVHASPPSGVSLYPSLPFILLPDPTNTSPCPVLITPLLLWGHMILITLPPSFCLHTVMTQNPRPPLRVKERETQI